jgi:predicted nucleic acid-binding Zn ribbon protein
MVLFMPRYIYVCENKHVLEESRTIEDRRRLTNCETCGKEMHLTISPYNYTGETQRRDRRKMYIQKGGALDQ